MNFTQFILSLLKTYTEEIYNAKKIVIILISMPMALLDKI